METSLKKIFLAASAVVAVVLSPLVLAAFPDKPITLYVSYGAGATTDISARALASAAEKILGVPITIENKAGGGGTVAAGLLTSKKPDGYTLLIGSSASLTVRPSIMKVSYDPANIIGLVQYSYFYNGSLVIPNDSPWKTLSDFVSYAKTHPGMSYATAGAGGIATTSQQLGVVALEQCFGLKFKHVPTKGGTEANTMLMGKHVDFTSGSGSHLPFIRDGAFRQLVVFQDRRDENFPTVPTLKDEGCAYDAPPDSAIMVSAPKGLPPEVSKKLEDTFTKIIKSDEFKTMLKQNYLPYEYKDSKRLALDLKSEADWYRSYLQSLGALKKD